MEDLTSTHRSANSPLRFGNMAFDSCPHVASASFSAFLLVGDAWKATAAEFQVKFRIREKRPALDESQFRKYLFHYDGPKFRLELSQAEVSCCQRSYSVEGDSRFESWSRLWRCLLVAILGSYGWLLALCSAS